MRLDRERIVDAAMALLDEVGLDAFSTRALAARLGVRQPALYWHFRNRRALLEAMNARMIAEAQVLDERNLLGHAAIVLTSPNGDELSAGPARRAHQ